jgi:hypothetical protein
MRSILNRLMPSLFGALLCAAPLTAQMSPTACGTRLVSAIDHQAAVRRTAERSPELYRQAMAEAKGMTTKLLSADEETFWVLDHNTAQFTQVKAVRVHMGRLARVWVDVRDTARADLKAKLPVLIKALEDSTAPGSRNPGKGIIENDVDVFGASPTNVGDGYQDFLLLDISSQEVLGFFLPLDQLTEPFSNRRNILYIDSREGLLNTSTILNTLAHEFQHLIHYGFNENSDLFINEGCSEVAGLICGYPDRTNPNYLRNTNTNLFNFPREDEILQNQAYERALTFFHYLYEQHGESFLRAIPKIGWQGMRVINDALDSVSPGLNWEKVGPGFAIANWLQSSDTPRFTYRVNITAATQRRARPLRTYTLGTQRPHDSVSLAPFGIGYIVYDNPAQLDMRFKGRYNFRVMAIGYRGDEVEVMDFEKGASVSIGNGAIYDRVILVLMELTNATQKITWDLNEGISGVESESASSATRFVKVYPNPMHDGGDITFATSGSAPVRLELHAPTGAVVRTLVDGEHLETGTHRVRVDASGLPAGAYIARLTQGDRSATHLVIVQ